MSATVTYSCPNCDAGLYFSPDKNSFCCEFCLSEFTKEQLDETASAEKAAARAKENEAFNEQMLEYHCERCGADIIADSATAATECYYCHQPVLLVGKLTGALKPSKIIPFAFSRDQAKERFLAFVKKHRFLPSDYYSPEQLEHIRQVYYPFWVTDADVFSTYRTVGHRTTSWREGDYICTKTSRYDVERAGEIHLEDIVTSALSTEDTRMLEGVLPFPSDAHVDFEMPYLLGSVAKKRDTEREALSERVRKKMEQHAHTLLSGTVRGYEGYTPPQTSLSVRSSHWEYTLLPIYVLTYRKQEKKTYVFAMNGHTGKIYGELPISWKKLLILFASVFGAVFLSLLVLLGL